MKTFLSRRRWNYSRFPLSFLFFFCLLFFFSCGSVIRKSTVQLSADVGQRLTEMEHLHQLAIQRYFDTEKQKVEDFLTNTWEPLFLKNFLGTSQVLQMLNNVSRIDEARKEQLEITFASYLDDPDEAKTATAELIKELNKSRKGEDGMVKTIVSKYVEEEQIESATIHLTSLMGTDDPARIIFEFTEAAHAEMNARRASLLAPIEQTRIETIAELSAAYAELIRGQSTITGRLEAAAKASDQQDKTLQMLGFNNTTKKLQAKLSNFTSNIDGALNVVSGLSATDEGGDMNLPANILSTLSERLSKANEPAMAPTGIVPPVLAPVTTPKN